MRARAGDCCPGSLSLSPCLSVNDRLSRPVSASCLSLALSLVSPVSVSLPALVSHQNLRKTNPQTNPTHSLTHPLSPPLTHQPCCSSGGSCAGSHMGVVAAASTRPLAPSSGPDRQAHRRAPSPAQPSPAPAVSPTSSTPRPKRPLLASPRLAACPAALPASTQTARRRSPSPTARRPRRQLRK